MENNLCVKDCSAGYMLVNNDHCDGCIDKNCKTCSPINICKNCTLGYFLQKDNTCNQDCPVGTFKNTNTQTCDNCILNCNKCVDNLTCKGCNVNFFLFNNECRDKCPVGYYPSNGQCYPCGDSNCSACYETTPEKCKNCKSPFKLYNSTCVANCTERTYDNALGECIDCGWKCQSCSDKNTCLKCYPPFIVDVDGICKDKCPSGSVEKDGKCIICTTQDTNCYKCNANNTAICDQCNFLKVVDTNNKCVDKCRDNYYSDGVKCKGKN